VWLEWDILPCVTIDDRHSRKATLPIRATALIVTHTPSSASQPAGENLRLVPLPYRCNCRWLVVDVLSIAARSFTAARMKRTISRPGDQLQILSVSVLTLSSVTRIRLQHSWPRAASARGQRPYATNQITPADMISRRGVWQTLGPLVQPSSKLGNRISAISSSNPLGRVTEARKARSWCAFVNSDVECTTVSTVNILSRHGSVAKAPGWPASCSHAVDYRGAHVDLDHYG